MVKTIKGKLLEPKMFPGEDGFMYASYRGAAPEEIEVPALLWQERQKPPPGDEAPVLKNPAMKKPTASRQEAGQTQS